MEKMMGEIERMLPSMVDQQVQKKMEEAAPAPSNFSVFQKDPPAITPMRKKPHYIVPEVFDIDQKLHKEKQSNVRYGVKKTVLPTVQNYF